MTEIPDSDSRPEQWRSTSRWCGLCGRGWCEQSQASSGQRKGMGRWRRRSWAMAQERKTKDRERMGRGGRWWHGWSLHWTGKWWHARLAPGFGFPSCHAETRCSPGSERAPSWQRVPETETAEWSTNSDTDILKCGFMRPTESNLVSCSATSLTGKSTKQNLASSVVSSLSSWSLNACCADSWLTSDADWLHSVKHMAS